MSDNNEQIIILGHSGFIGSYLENFLIAENLKVIGRSLPEIDLCNSQDLNKIEDFFTPYTTVILTAAVKRQFGDTLQAFKTNMTIVENVCDLLAKKPVKRFIFFSSAAVYGEETHNTSISENTPVNPTSYYGIAKYTAERILQKAVELTGNNTLLVNLRPPLIYGPGDQGKTYGPSGFSASAIEGSKITLWGDGTELREFLFIEDLANIVLALTKSDFSGVLNPVSGKSYCFADIIVSLKKKFPDLQADLKPRSKNKADNAFIGYKLKAVIGKEFKFTTLDDGLSKTLSNS